MMARNSEAHDGLLFEIFNQDKTTGTVERGIALERSLGLVFYASGDCLCRCGCGVGAGALLEGAERSVSL